MTSTIMTTGGDGILKVDRAGRVQTPLDRREALLDEFERSGGSAAQFAALMGIKYTTFGNWIQARRKQRRVVQAGGSQSMETAKPASAVTWVETVVETSSSRSEEAVLRVNLPGGAHVDIANATQAKLAAQLLVHLGPRES